MDEQNQQPQQENQDLTTHEKKQLKKQQKHEEKHQQQGTRGKKQFNKKIIKYSITAAVVILLILGIYFFIIKPIRSFNPVHSGPYHWHANFEVSICGEPAQIKCGAGMCGPMSLHHHNDDIIHIEGSVIAKEEDIALGKFFDGLNLEFSETNLLGKKNGDLCPDGNPGTVKMYVNGVENNQFRNYILKRCDAGSTQEIRQQCEKIELKFE